MVVFYIRQQTLFFAQEDVCPSFPMLFALELRSISHPLSPAACTAKHSQSGSQRSCEFFALCKTGLNKQLDAAHLSTTNSLWISDILWLVIDTPKLSLS